MANNFWNNSKTLMIAGVATLGISLQAATTSNSGWSYQTQATQMTSTINTETSNDVSTTILGVAGSYKFKNQYQLTFGTKFLRDNFQRDRESISQGDAQFTLVFPAAKTLNKTLSFAPYSTLGVPLSDRSRADTLMAAITLGTLVGLNTGNSSFGLGANFSGTQRIYEYIESAGGAPNVKYIVSSSVDVSYSPGKKFKMSASAGFTALQKFSKLWSSSYSITESISYQFRPTLVASLSHSNGGLIYRPDGVTSNVQLFDERSSLIYLSMAWGF